jgi:hypothetical protein
MHAMVDRTRGHRIQGATMLGYPKYPYAAIAARKPLDVRRQ